MNGKYTPVVGLEIHLQPKIKSKMFCGCNAKYFGQKPNTYTCPVCLGLPGALPVPNKVAIEKCIKTSLGLNCKINKETKFDRKNYFYPDLPKGYQISQFDKPFGYEGYLEFDINGDSRRIRITRVHMEEDTAKSIHEENRTLIDFNKSGLALIEIVTEPDFQTPEEVDKFAKRLRQIVRYLDISDADMEKGQMRYELNMSLKKPGEQGLPNYKVEIKNIASISMLQKVMEYEYKRQSKLLDNSDIPEQETRGIRNQSGETYSQRVKESSDDYRYFPEPDIPPIEVSDEWIQEIRSTMIELPQVKKDRYVFDLGLELNTAEVLVQNIHRARFFEECLVVMSKDINIKKHTREVAKWVNGHLRSLMKVSNDTFANIKVTPLDIIELIIKLDSGKITGTIAKNVLTQTYESGKSVESIINDQGLEVVSDEGIIEDFVNQVIADNQKVVADIAKNPNAIKFLVGQVMRLSKGKASPHKAEEILSQKLG